MSNDTDTIDIDGMTVEVADDPADARMLAVGMTVSADETVSTGDYESFDAYQSTKVRIDPAIDLGDPEGRRALRTMARTLHSDIQDDLDHAIGNRLSEPDFEDWPDVEPRDRTNADTQTDD